jgi:hypothetical protein
MLEDNGMQVSVMAGHVHKRVFWEQSGADYTVNGINSGALSIPNPHYLPEGQSKPEGRRWTQGTAVATLDLRARLVQFENVGFADIGDNKTAFYRGQLLSSERREGPGMLRKRVKELTEMQL